MTKPTIHSNGTDPETLAEGYVEAYRAVNAAIGKLGDVEFNARDYYPQGPDAWTEAVKEQAARGMALKRVADELLELAMHCRDAADERDARRKRLAADCGKP